MKVHYELFSVWVKTDKVKQDKMNLDKLYIILKV